MSGPASPTRRCACSGTSSARCAAPTRRSPLRPRPSTPGPPCGSNPGWSSRSRSTAGPRPAGCAPRSTRACATTSTPRRWSVSPDTKVAVQVDGRTLTLTNLAKVLYPETGFTKAEVLDYYQRVAPVLLPHIAARPLTLKRYPEGVDGEAFFQKHVTQHRPDWIRTARIPSESSRGRGAGPVTYLVVDDLPALIWAANLAGLELHVPQWRVPGLRRPDLLVFDLDPGAPANIVDCCRVAEDLRPLLEADGFAPLAKTSGGKGLQLYAPISGVTSDQASDRARAFAERLERDQPRRVVSRMTKVLRTGKVLIDWSQNNGSKTTVAPYSLRARQSPTVSTPVSWDEVQACRRPEELFFTADLVLDRVDKRGDLFAPLLGPPKP